MHTPGMMSDVTYLFSEVVRVEWPEGEKEPSVKHEMYILDELKGKSFAIMGEPNRG